MGIKLAFMGTSTFAVPTLDRLFHGGYAIAGVFTQPDKPSGRGRNLHSSPVKQAAESLRLPVYQPASLKDAAARELFDALTPDLIAVVAYGTILPAWLLGLPRFGCVNLHGSLLPRYRGAAPVHWAIANGETTTGVCTMRLDEGLDTGPVFLSEKTHIGPEETVQQLYDRLAAIGAPLMSETVRGIVNGTLRPEPQDDAEATFAPVLKKEHGFLDWSMPAAEIHNRVRAFNPWPGTVTRFRGSVCKILATRTGAACEGEPGGIVVTKRALSVICGDFTLLEILSIQAENRKPVPGGDFANGAHVQAGEKFDAVEDN